MQFITEIGTIVLGTYLAFTNALAGFLMPPHEKPTSPVTSVAEETRSLTQLGSMYESIPDILIKSARFQQANVFGALGSPTSSPHTAKEAALNIYCTYTTDSAVRATTGSGFFITPTGAILTNAHVAQFLLLEQSEREGETTCVVRTGSPATTTYEAKLLYIPPAWISEHANLINAKTPKGTGERDYALLYAASSLTKSPMPARFPYLSLSNDSLKHNDIGASVAVAGYPADPLYENGAESDLYMAQAESSITDLFTFGSDTADLMSLYESPVSVGGSSGGPVTDASGKVIGVIVTRGETKEDSLRAITTTYINRTLAEETGFDIHSYLRGDLALRAAVFEEALSPFLLQLLEFELAD